ncbi:MAG: undecaprenyl-diphosphatase UppP [Candidatus Eremiobacteraeota bacterium]|nr:undecaprenyl-diphosphatase UppP [Candidatus Eremiobacteraeota bacterium]
MPHPTIEALLLGIIQGATEFLPVSSSAHLVIFPLVFHWEYFGKAFDVAAHLGTLLALLVYFRGELFGLVTGFFKSFCPGGLRNNPEGRLAWFMLISTTPAAIFGLLMGEWIAEHMNTVPKIASMLIIFGIILFMADRFGAKKREIKDLTWADALLIGLAQALALMPGVSRSGVTMTYALLAGFSRSASARYSFLISIPVIAAAAIYQVGKMISCGYLTCPLIPTIVVILASTITGYVIVAFLLNFLKKNKFDVFVIYRTLLGLLLLYFAFLA